MELIPLIARICLAAIFLWSGFGKLQDPAGTQQLMASMSIPFPPLMLVGSILFELVGALSVLLGYKTRWGAIALIIFMIPTTLIFHANFGDRTQVTQFLKNLAIIGGLLMLIYAGPGRLSLDLRTASRKRW